VTPPRYAPAMAYNRAAGQMVLFGGQSASMGAQNDTWIFDDKSLAWTMATPPAPIPPPIYGGGAFYDDARKQVVLVGGQAGADFGKTYTWDGTKWTAATGPTDASCEARLNMGLAYDARRKRGVLFGGASATPNTDTCEWDGKGWTKMSPLTGPPTGGARNGCAMTFDSKRGSMYMTGVTNDIWEYHATANGCASDGDCDTGHCVDGLCCEVASCPTCQACNVDVMSAGACTNVPKGARDLDSCSGSCDGNGGCLP
jgi:hypothetical protein